MTRAALNRRLSFAVAIAVLAVLPYANSLGGDFVWDDRPLILQSPTVQSISSLGEIFSGDFFSHSQNPLPYGYYRPITTLSFVLDWWVWGDDPTGFHITNIALHSIASILVLFLLLRLGLDEALSLTIAAVFAFHPIHTENVTWISGRTDVLAFVFAAGALLLDLYARDGAPKADVHKKEKGKNRKGPPSTCPSPRTTRPFLVALAVVSFAAAMLAKEMAVVLPFWVFLIAALHDRTGLKRAALRAVPFVVVVAAYAVLRLTILQVPPPGQPLEHTLTNTLLSAPVTIVRYLGWMILPLDLNAYAQNPYVTTVTDVRFLGSFAVLAVLAAVAFYLARRNRQLLLFSSMLAVSFLPVLNIVRVASPVDMGNTMAERFCYFPSFPFLAAVFVTVPLVLPRVRKRRRAVRATTVILFLLVPSAVITWDRAGDWRDEISLFSGMTRQAPEATLPWSQLALSHLRKGRADEARKALERAEDIDPADLQLLSARTGLLVVEGRAMEAIPLQKRLVRSAGPGRPQAMNNLAYLYRVSERPGDARRVLEQIIDSGQAYADVWFNLAEVEHQENNFEEAITAFERAWKSNPRDPRYARRLAQERVGFARLLARADRRDEATSHLQKVLIQTEDTKLRTIAITELDRLDAMAAPSKSRGY